MVSDPNGGGVFFFGSPDSVDVSAPFLVTLVDLKPTERRFALAVACAMPWRSEPESMPACYQRDLAEAEADFHDEYGPNASGRRAQIDRLFDEEPEPIAKAMLLELAPQTPTGRRSCLALAMSTEWWDAPELAPAYIRRAFDFTSAEGSDEYRYWVQAGGSRRHARPAEPGDPIA